MPTVNLYHRVTVAVRGRFQRALKAHRGPASSGLVGQGCSGVDGEEKGFARGKGIPEG